MEMEFNENNIDLETIIRDEVNKYLSRDIGDLRDTTGTARVEREI